MATAHYKVSEARAHFSELLRRAHAGEEIVITHGSEPMARLVPARKRGERRPGVLRALLSEEEIAALTEAVETPLSEADRRSLEGEDTNDVGIWIGPRKDRDGDSGKGGA